MLNFSQEFKYVYVNNSYYLKTKVKMYKRLYGYLRDNFTKIEMKIESCLKYQLILQNPKILETLLCVDYNFITRGL